MTRPKPLWATLTVEEHDLGWAGEPPSRVTAAEVLDALERRHADKTPAGYDEPWSARPGRWAFLREVQAATGGYADSQRLDALAVGLVPSVRYARVAYEVKVSRSDWLHELRPRHDVSRGVGRWASGYHRRLAETAEGRAELAAQGWAVHERRKWDQMLALSNEAWFAAPPQVIAPAEVPPGCGLLEVRPWRGALRARAVVKAEWRDTPHPAPPFWAAALRVMADRRYERAEAKALEVLGDPAQARALARRLNGPRWGEDPDD